MMIIMETKQNKNKQRIKREEKDYNFHRHPGKNIQNYYIENISTMIM